MENTIDNVQLNFNQDSLWILNICLGIIMFGVALGLKINDFKDVARHPKSALLGVAAQFLVLPALTFVLVFLLQPAPSIALGMIMVAACPGGNISNFISQMSGGNAALSVSLTAIATILAIIFTPLNLELWASLYPPTRSILREVSLEPLQVFKTVGLILGIPLILGLICVHKLPGLAARLVKILKPLSLMIFAGFVIIAFSNNWSVFLDHIHAIILIVLLHNAVALSAGYGLGALFRRPLRDRKTLAIETGIQNSGLGLLLIFSYFNGLGGMAIVAAWWGIWHIISGLLIAYYWSGVKAVQTVA